MLAAPSRHWNGHCAAKKSGKECAEQSLKVSGWDGLRSMLTMHAMVRDRRSGLSLTECAKKYGISRASGVRFVGKPSAVNLAGRRAP